MSDPVVTAQDLATYLNDASIDTVRADALIADAQTLCESVVSPLPAGAAVVVKRIAARAYVTITSARQAQLAAAGSPFGAMPSGTGEVWLSSSDKKDLRRLAGGTSGAFSIDTLPAGYTPIAPVWDLNDGPYYGGFGYDGLGYGG